MSHAVSTSCRSHVGEQLVTAGVVAGFGLVGILMYGNEQLGYMLAVPFHLPVLLGGIALIVLAAIRSISVWCGLRDHFHAEGESHAHDWTWTLCRLEVLAFPVCIFLLGLPNSGFSQDRIRMLLGGDDALTANLSDAAFQNGTVGTLRELRDAAGDEQERERMTGRTAIIEGHVKSINSREFTLFRLAMVCCAPDAVPRKVRIVLKNGTLNRNDDFAWVRIRGRIQFVQPPNSEQYIPVVVVENAEDVRRMPEPAQTYER